MSVNSGLATEAVSLAMQCKIFKFAEQEQIELANALSHFGCSFDQLRYETSATKTWIGKPSKCLDDVKMPEHGIPLVSFFTGCGGLDLGFEYAGFKHLAAFEFSELFCNTLRKNRPEWRVYGPPTCPGDVSNTCEVIAALEKIIPLKFEGIFAGGPPCQPFSIAANQRFAKSGDNFKRIGFDHEENGNLLFDYISIIKHFQPSCFIIENVPGLRDIDGGKQLTAALKELESTGYKIAKPRLLNAVHYGVPQYRVRLFVIGTNKRQIPVFPSPEIETYGSGSVLPRDQGNAPNIETRVHKLSSVKRYSKLDYGKRDPLGRVDRLDPCQPSKTVIAGGLKGGGRSHLHPEIPRTLSVRECARLQTFPDNYTFTGPTARQFTQVGNAVPPVLAAQLGTAIAQSVFGAAP